MIEPNKLVGHWEKLKKSGYSEKDIDQKYNQIKESLKILEENEILSSEERLEELKALQTAYKARLSL